jgi:endoglucanase
LNARSMLSLVFFALVFCSCHHASAQSTGATLAPPSTSDLHLTEHDVLEAHGLSVLLFHDEYHRVFGDQKMNGMEIILHDQRIVTGGDVRLSATPEQWDPIPDFEERKRIAPDEVAATCTYPAAAPGVP